MKKMGSMSRNKPSTNESSRRDGSSSQRDGMFLHATQSYEPQCANDQATEFRVTRPEIQTAIVLEEDKSKLNRI
jgi:hypothetical protein